MGETPESRRVRHDEKRHRSLRECGGFPWALLPTLSREKERGGRGMRQPAPSRMRLQQHRTILPVCRTGVKVLALGGSWTPEERDGHFAKKEAARLERAAAFEAKNAAEAAKREERITAPSKPAASRFTTQAAIDWGRRNGWHLIDRENYDARTKRHRDLMLGTDCLFDDGGTGMVAIQGAGKAREGPPPRALREGGRRGDGEAPRRPGALPGVRAGRTRPRRPRGVVLTALNRVKAALPAFEQHGRVCKALCPCHVDAKTPRSSSSRARGA